MTSEPEDDETKAPPAEAALPSVIVDASFLEEGRARPEPVQPGRAEFERIEPARIEPERVHPGPEEPERVEPERTEPSARPSAASLKDRLSGGATEAGRLSSLEADRFAASFRASWEPPAAAGAVQAAAPAAASPATSAAVASIEDDSLPAPALPRRAGKMTAFLVIAVAIAAFGGLLAYVVGGGETDRRPGWNRGGSTPTRPPPIEPLPAPALPPPAASATTTGTAQPTSIVAPAPAVSAPAAEAPAPAAIAPVAPTPQAPAAAPAPVAAEAHAEAPTPAPEPPAERAPAVAKPPEPVAKIRVRVSVTPRGAELRLDGERVANPYDKTLASGGTRTFEARAFGYVAQTRTVALDRNQVIVLNLDRARPVGSSSSAPHPKRPAPRPAPRTHSASTSQKSAGFVADSPY